MQIIYALFSAIFSEVNGCFEEINISKYLTLVPNNGIKEKHEIYEMLEI